MADRRRQLARPPRDSDRSAVYEAEHLVHRILDRGDEFPTVQVAGSTLTLPRERRFASIESVQQFVDAVLALGPVRRDHPERSALPVRVRRRSGRTQAHYEYLTATLALPTGLGEAGWAMRELVVLHELAHHLVGDGPARHGVEFRRALLSLVEATLGPELRLLLYVSYGDTGLRPPG